MTDLHLTPDPEEARLTEAAAWRARLSEADQATSAAFEQWLADPANAEAWSQVEAAWDFVGAAGAEPDMTALRRAALEDARRAGARNNPIRFWRAVASIAAVLLVAIVGTWGTLAWLEAPLRYATEAGERRVITLADGSRVSLDSRSEVTVNYSRTARELHLVRGQARFDVTHDVERPFSVVAGDRKVIATGTAFNIDIMSGSIVVTLIQGRVAVLREEEHSSLPQKRAIELEAGQQLAETSGADVKVSQANIPRATAWTNGQLMFQDDTLNVVVEHMNRYTAKPIVIADAKVGAMRISGVFNSSDTVGFVDTVTNYLPVETGTDEAGRIVLKAKN